MKIQTALEKLGFSKPVATFVGKGYEGLDFDDLDGFRTAFYFEDILSKTLMVYNERYRAWASVPSFTSEDLALLHNRRKLLRAAKK